MGWSGDEAKEVRKRTAWGQSDEPAARRWRGTQTADLGKLNELILAGREGGRGLTASSFSVHCTAADVEHRKKGKPWILIRGLSAFYHRGDYLHGKNNNLL